MTRTASQGVVSGGQGSGGRPFAQTGATQCSTLGSGVQKGAVTTGIHRVSMEVGIHSKLNIERQLCEAVWDPVNEIHRGTVP